MNAYLARWRGLAIQLVAILTLAAIMVFPAQSAFAQAGNPAEAFVQQNVNRGYQILNNPALSGAQRHDQFRDFLLTLTDLHRIGTFTLGQYANSASPADLQAFDKAFTDYSVAVCRVAAGKIYGPDTESDGLGSARG